MLRKGMLPIALIAVLLGEAEVAGQVLPDHTTVQPLHIAYPTCMQLLLNCHRQCCLPRSGETGKPDDKSFVHLAPPQLVFVHR